MERSHACHVPCRAVPLVIAASASALALAFWEVWEVWEVGGGPQVTLLGELRAQGQVCTRTYLYSG